ncbi:MAG: transposase, partial [Deltaproteobacteria bacterium]|nr:transposase [Deltaproteobacteria bacterium]
TEWLIEYNFHRPHQALGYQTPIAFHYQHHKVLPMYPSSTIALLHKDDMVFPPSCVKSWSC